MDEGIQINSTKDFSPETNSATPNQETDVAQPSNAGIGIEYRKLRSPQQHGQALTIPGLSQIDQVWQRIQDLDNQTTDIGGVSLADLQRIGRRELIHCATRYSQSYLDVERSDWTQHRIVMAGHQPELFHPGVWYKNFVLAELGARFQATPINLIVDNDIDTHKSIRFPNIEGSRVSIGTIPLAPPGPNVPFEVSAIEDREFFESFPSRVADSMGNLVPDPIVNRLWPHVIEASRRLGNGNPNLGQSLAAGRHRLEHEHGLRTLEVPISHLAQTSSFATFVRSILSDIDRFRDAYNQSLLQYRQLHRIRSRSHPVPELEKIDDWVETPLWIWSTDRPNRRRLFCKQNRGMIQLSDRDRWQTQSDSNSFVEQICNLGAQGIAIRPRALMTTMFSRLILSDLFLHGIGGAKYDQLTDRIIDQFFSTKPPEFLTISATMKLPSPFEIVRKTDLVTLRQLARELKYHPESHLSTLTPETRRLVEQKRSWTTGKHRMERSKRKHDAINRLNWELSKYVDVKHDELLTAENQISQKLRASEILDSREYSYCLFPGWLISELKSLAKVPD